MIVGYFGTMSSGKGVMSSKMLRSLHKDNPKKIIANCFINEKNLILLNSEELYLKSKEPKFFTESFLYISELHNIIDARRAGSAMNTNFTQFLTQIGKLDCSIIYDSQIFESQIDLRLREFTNLIFLCERFKIIDGKIKSAIFDDRIIKEQVAIKLQLDKSTETKEKIINLGYYLPTKEDYEYFKTREIITLDRDKFLRK